MTVGQLFWLHSRERIWHKMSLGGLGVHDWIGSSQNCMVCKLNLVSCPFCALINLWRLPDWSMVILFETIMTLLSESVLINSKQMWIPNKIHADWLMLARILFKGAWHYAYHVIEGSEASLHLPSTGRGGKIVLFSY
jgi:hypothetical protein